MRKLSSRVLISFGQLSIPISLAEELLSTEYYIYENADGDFIARTTSYSLPAHVHAHVDVVQPTTMFGLFKPMRTTSHLGKVEDLVPAAAGTMLASTGTTVNISCNTTITPQCIYELYGVDYKATANNGNKIGITGALWASTAMTRMADGYDRLPRAILQL
jgi:tripeptidyl-peptidase-1